MKLNLVVAHTASVLVPTFALAQSPANAFVEQNSRMIAWVIVLYILPSIIALYRKHPSKGSIIAVNIVLGWTAIGWLWSLVWSLGSKGQTVVVMNAPSATASQSPPVGSHVANKTAGDRIAELKAMLEAGTISQNEFDMLKAEALKALA